ncbi:MAG: response regulator transcription factor [Nocardioidaceae bacterium]
MPGAVHNVLVVEDDPAVRDVVRRYLERDGHRVTVCVDGETALAAHREDPADLVVLDVMLPGIDGLEVCRRLRSGPTNAQVPIIMLTALSEEDDRILGLTIGADDYVTKPFSPRELALRVQSVLRRQGGAPHSGTLPDRLVDGDLVVDVAARTVVLAGRTMSLTLREFDLLAFLMAHPGEVFTRAELLEQVWGWSFGDQSTVTVHVKRLRSKVEDDPATPRRIATVYGLGYRYDRQERPR